jgi:hypothetical protein
MHVRLVSLWFKGDSRSGSLVPYLYDRYETFHVKMVSNNDGNLDYCWENILELLEHEQSGSVWSIIFQKSSREEHLLYWICKMSN